MIEICIQSQYQSPSTLQNIVPIVDPTTVTLPNFAQAHNDHEKQTTSECFTYRFFGGSEKESLQINQSIEKIANESTLLSSYIASAFRIPDFTIIVCDTKHQPNVLASYDPLNKTLRLPRSILKHPRFMESLRHELYHAHCHARYIANEKHNYANIAFAGDHTFPFQNIDEKIAIQEYLKKGYQRIQEFNIAPEPAVFEKLSTQIESMKQTYHYSVTRKNPELNKGIRGIIEAQSIASPEFHKFLATEGYPEEQYLSEQLAHFVGRTPPPVIKKFFPELNTYITAKANATINKINVLNSVPFQPTQDENKYCEAPLTFPIDIIIDNYKLEANAENIDIFFNRIEVLFKGCVDNLRAREELKNNIQSVLNKGLIAGNARYRLKAHLYLAGIAVLETGRDDANVEKWKDIATLYKRAEKDLDDTSMEINPYVPEFLHDNFYAYALYKTGSQKKAEQVAQRKPFTPK